MDTALAGDDISQFNGSATRALTSQIDLTGPPPAGDNGAGFSRTVADGELVPPRDGPRDFCVLTFGVEPGPGGELPFSWAFCVGALVRARRAFRLSKSLPTCAHLRERHSTGGQATFTRMWGPERPTSRRTHVSTLAVLR